MLRSWKAASLINATRMISTTAVNEQIIKLSRLRVVDNSLLGQEAEQASRPPRCIHVYNPKGVGTIGDRILVAIKGQKKQAYIVGVKQKQKAMVPRFDSNNIVLVEDNGTPTGTRIRVPIPSKLRGKEGEFSKII